MTGTRVVLITASGPGGQIDIGVRADATPTDLVGALGSVIGIGPGSSVVEHHAPPRPGMPQGRRVQLTGEASLAGSGVADGDMIIFRKPSDRSSVSPHGDPGGPTRSSRGDSPDSEVTRPDLPSLPRVDLPHAHVTRQADDSTRPAPRREPGAHRASGSGNGRSYRPGPTRGIESDEPDNRP